MVSLSILLFAFCIILAAFLSRIIDNEFLEVLMIIGMILVTLIVPGAITILIYLPIAKIIQPSAVGELSLQNIQDITTPLRNYYKLFGCSMTTKCYRCSNKSFNNKDVIIFLHKNAIRIIVDIFHSTKDIGCYELTLEELETSYIEEEGRTKTVLKGKDIEFVIGKRAKPFIKKCFSSSKCPCCGYYTFLEMDRGMYNICPVCFWEDDSEQEKKPDFDGGANQISLIEARKNYKEYGACSKNLVKYCRPPRKDEIKKI